MTKIVEVKFDTGFKIYEFKSDIEGLAVGDKVVVDTAVGHTVGNVVGFKDVSKFAYRWVIQKVDLEGHLKRLEKEKKLSEIKTKMENRRKEIQEIEIYQILAKEDEGMAELLKEFQALN